MTSFIKSTVSIFAAIFFFGSANAGLTFSQRTHQFIEYSESIIYGEVKNITEACKKEEKDFSYLGGGQGQDVVEYTKCTKEILIDIIENYKGSNEVGSEIVLFSSQYNISHPLIPSQCVHESISIGEEYVFLPDMDGEINVCGHIILGNSVISQTQYLVCNNSIAFCGFSGEWEILTNQHEELIEKLLKDWIQEASLEEVGDIIKKIEDKRRDILEKSNDVEFAKGTPMYNDFWFSMEVLAKVLSLL